ncbi:hypothetical protein AKO1_001962 [Acrasis kona]|uniref:Uncharacterized protein n=1 Tax=Acrasis kona TaxID=1008807 RepID=A0AAW2ZCN0_9EUKA
MSSVTPQQREAFFLKYLKQIIEDKEIDGELIERAKLMIEAFEKKRLTEDQKNECYSMLDGIDEKVRGDDDYVSPAACRSEKKRGRKSGTKQI